MCSRRWERAKPHTSTARIGHLGEPGAPGLGGTLIVSTTEVPTQLVGFIVSLIIAFALVALIIPMAKRRPVGTSLTWGEAMAAATYVFFTLFWVYAMVPHLWLTWASNELQWRPDKLLFGPGGVLKPQKSGGWNPVTLNYEALRDIIAVLIYVVFLGVNMYMWAWWQNRGKRAEMATTPAVVTSDYGRPLVKKS